MMGGEKTFVLFAPGDPGAAGGGTIRDQTVHESEVIPFDPDNNLIKGTIPLDNELDQPVEVKLYGRTEKDTDHWHLLQTVNLTAGTPSVPKQDHITLTDNWRALKLSVKAQGADPTAGDFKAKLIPIQEGM